MVVHDGGFIRKPVFNFQSLSLVRENAEPLPDIIRDFPAGDADDGCVTDGALLEYRQVGRPPSDIDQRYADLLLLVVQHGVTRSQRFQDHIIHLKACALHALVNILSSCDKSGHDVHDSLHAHA